MRVARVLQVAAWLELQEGRAGLGLVRTCFSPACSLDLRAWQAAHLTPLRLTAGAQLAGMRTRRCAAQCNDRHRGGAARSWRLPWCESGRCDALCTSLGSHSLGRAIGAAWATGRRRARPARLDDLDVGTRWSSTRTSRPAARATRHEGRHQVSSST